MNDLDQRLRRHLQEKAAALQPSDRLAQVRAARAASARHRFVARPAWLGIAAGTVAAAGVGAFMLVNRSPDASPVQPTAPPGALPLSPGPTVNDHWHTAYGFWLCGEWRTLAGVAEEPPVQAYIETGLHSHDDGVIHIHPFASGGTGDNATLGTFLRVYDVELSDAALRFPPAQGGDEVSMACDGAPATLSVTVWPDAGDTANAVTLTSDLAGVRLRDGEAITIAVAAPGAAIPPPPSAPQLGELGAIDGGGTQSTG